MKTKKIMKFTLAIPATLMVLALAACNGQKENNGQTDNNGENEPDVCCEDTLEYPGFVIDAQREEVKVCISDDERLRLYCWYPDSEWGGNCPEPTVMAQYRTKSGEVRTRRLNDSEADRAWIRTLHTIKKDDGHTYYLAVRSMRASANDGYTWVNAFAIVGDSLMDVAAVDGSADMDNGKLPDVNYNISDWYDKTYGEGYAWIYAYDKAQRNLYIPVTEGEQSPQKMTDRYVLYHFDGKRFVNKGEVAHHGLHPSVQQYKRLLYFFRTADYILRVDEMADGTMRYAQWPSTATLAEKPELVITGGTCKTVDHEDIYTFRHDGAEYVVGYGETQQNAEGYSTYREYFVVKKGGKTVVKQVRVEAP